MDHMCDEEEIVIHTTLNELEESEEPSNMFSSRIDPYTNVRYGSLRDEIGVVEEMKCIAGAADLKELLGNYCRLPGCNMKIRCTEIKATCGYALKLEWLCEAMHRGIWYSSSIYASGFAVNYVVETALLLAGMNHHQFQRFCQFINLVHASPSSYARNQRFYAAPAIHQEYIGMRDAIVEDIKKQDGVVLSGDARMDSPGFSATKATYSFMEEQGSHRVISMEHGDKRQVRMLILM